MTNGKKDTTSEVIDIGFLTDIVSELQIMVGNNSAAIIQSTKDNTALAVEVIQAMATLTERFAENQRSLTKLLSSIELIIQRVKALEETNALLYHKNKALS
jgi:phage shock protein A